MKAQKPISTRGIEVATLEVEEIEIKAVEAYKPKTGASPAPARTPLQRREMTTHRAAA